MKKEKSKKSWWERLHEGCISFAFINDIKPECLTDNAKIKYKEELEFVKENKMDERTDIKSELEVLLDALYELGKVDGMKEERLEEKDVYTRGFDAGHNVGYAEAMRDFRVPDL